MYFICTRVYITVCVYRRPRTQYFITATPYNRRRHPPPPLSPLRRRREPNDRARTHTQTRVRRRRHRRRRRVVARSPPLRLPARVF